MKKIDWSKWSAIAEIVSSIAILVTLLYLVIQTQQLQIQTQQTNAALLASSRQATLEGDLDWLSDFINHPIDFLTADTTPLSPEDEQRFLALIFKALRVREYAWFQYQNGVLDQETWQSYMGPLIGVLSSERARDVLDGYFGDEEFKVYVRNWLSEAGQAAP